MTTKIITETTQALMKRREVILEIDHSKKATPKTEDVTKAVADVTKADEKLISVKEVVDEYGSNTARIKAYIYEDEKAKDAIEKINKKKIIQAEIKAAHEAKKKEAEAPKEEVKEEPKETPVEAPKEEAPAEKTKEE